MVKLPKTVRVGCFDYKIVFPYKFVEADDRTAQHSYYDLDIRIAEEHRRKRNETKLLVSFLHELIHAIDYSYGLLMFSEEQVNALSNLLFQFIRENAQDYWDIPKNKTLNILGQTYRIETGVEFEELDDLASMADHDNCFIYVSAIAKTPAMQRAFVFFHVLTSMNVMVSLELREDVLERFAFAFLDTMDRNKLWKLFTKKER